jgi:16S rRNA (cytosine967-C5)-methyltransferase
VAFDVLRAVAERDAYANLLLPSLLNQRGISGRDAAFATELTYGTLRGMGTYDAILGVCSDRDDLDPPVRDILRLGAHQLLATRVGSHAAVATSVDLAKDACGPRPSGFVNAVLRRVSTRDLDAWTELVAPRRSGDETGYLSVKYSYPRWIVEAFHDALGEPGYQETEQALAAGNERPDVVLAVLSGTVTELDAEPSRWSPFGMRLTAGGDPAPLIASGRAAAQDEASQLVTLALASVPLAGTRGSDEEAGSTGTDRRWLDMCAGPGGKARLLSHLAAGYNPAGHTAAGYNPAGHTAAGYAPAWHALAGHDARLVAAEYRPHRAKRVQEALARSGAASGAVLIADGLRAPWRPQAFDRVLADVPCSGLGSLRRRPEARWRKTPADIPELATLQRGLLNSAIDSIRPGGVVAYVTCSPHVAETYDVVTAVTGARPDVTVLDATAVMKEIPDLASPRDPRMAQFWPHRHGTDAMFLALLRRE